MTSVFGRVINGNITHATDRNVEQWPDEQFLPLLDAVLEHVPSVRWTQYTPYFNDGEPCIFGVNDVTVRVNGADDDYDDDYVDSWQMWDYSSPRAGDRVVKPEFGNVLPPLQTLSDSMAHFETFLKNTFGDHAIVTATREGFNVEFYEHD